MMVLNYCAYYALTRVFFRHDFSCLFGTFYILELYFSWSLKADSICKHSFWSFSLKNKLANSEDDQLLVNKWS